MARKVTLVSCIAILSLGFMVDTVALTQVFPRKKNSVSLQRCWPTNAPYSSSSFLSEGREGKNMQKLKASQYYFWNKSALDMMALVNCFVFNRLHRIGSRGQPTRGSPLRWSLEGWFTMCKYKDESAKKCHKGPQNWQVLLKVWNLCTNWTSVSCMQPVVQ